MAVDTRTVDPHLLGQRIASLRRASGWSQRRLAEAAGVSHGYIALLELGRLPSPGKFRLDAVARALNLRTSAALTGPVMPLPTLGQRLHELEPDDPSVTRPGTSPPTASTTPRPPPPCRLRP